MFRDIPSLQLVECSGELLDSSIDILGISIFTTVSHAVVAYVNLRSGECSTSGSYSSCVIDKSDTRKTRLVVLVDDLTENQSRAYGCNVTSFRAGHSHVVSWSISVHGLSRY